MKTTLVIILMFFLSFVLLSGKSSETKNLQNNNVSEQIQNNGQSLILYSSNDHLFRDSKKKSLYQTVCLANCAQTIKSYNSKSSAF
jgi:hypothetical protein